MTHDDKLRFARKISEMSPPFSGSFDPFLVGTDSFDDCAFRLIEAMINDREEAIERIEE